MPSSRTHLLVILAAALPLASLAANPEGQRLPTFEQVDANRDGVLSRSELPDSLHDMRAHFRQYAYVGNRVSHETYAWHVATAGAPDRVWITLADSQAAP